MEVSVDSSVLSGNYVYNNSEFLNEVTNSGGGSSTLVGDDYVSKSGDIMTGNLTVPNVSSSQLILTNTTNANTATIVGDGIQNVNIDANWASSSFKIKTYNSSMVLRTFTFDYDKLDLNDVKITNCPSIAPRGFCRLQLFTEGGLNYLRPASWSGIYFQGRTPTTQTSVAVRIGIGAFTVHINMDTAEIPTNTNVNAIIVNATGNFNGASGGSNGLVITETGTRLFTAASGSTPNMISISFQYVRVSALTTLVDLVSGGYIHINYSVFQPLAIVT